MTMNYEDLASRLQETSARILSRRDLLEGAALARVATGLETALDRFDLRLRDFLAGHEPGLRELSELLVSPQARALLKVPGWAVLFRRLWGMAPAGRTQAVLRKEFLGRVTAGRCGEDALAAVRLFFVEAARPLPPGNDPASLRRELLRLGNLSDEELSLEFSHRLKSATVLRELARSNAIPVPPRASKEKLATVLTHYARRAAANIDPGDLL
jgi:hypothetical protein